MKAPAFSCGIVRARALDLGIYKESSRQVTNYLVFSFVNRILGRTFINEHIYRTATNMVRESDREIPYGHWMISVEKQSGCDGGET